MWRADRKIHHSPFRTNSITCAGTVLPFLLQSLLGGREVRNLLLYIHTAPSILYTYMYMYLQNGIRICAHSTNKTYMYSTITTGSVRLGRCIMYMSVVCHQLAWGVQPTAILLTWSKPHPYIHVLGSRAVLIIWNKRIPQYARTEQVYTQRLQIWM